MTQPSLDERYRDRPPTRASQDQHRWMTSDEHRFVLWGLKEGWSAARIGRALGVNEATVRRFRARFKKDPQTLLKLGLHEMVGSASDDEYRCLVCEDHVIGRQHVDRHIIAHYADEPDVVASDPPAVQSPAPLVQAEAVDATEASMASTAEVANDNEPPQQAAQERHTGLAGPIAEPKSEPDLETLIAAMAKLEPADPAPRAHDAGSTLTGLLGSAIDRINKRHKEFERLARAPESPTAPESGEDALPDGGLAEMSSGVPSPTGEEAGPIPDVLQEAERPPIIDQDSDKPRSAVEMIEASTEQPDQKAADVTDEQLSKPQVIDVESKQVAPGDSVDEERRESSASPATEQEPRDEQMVTPLLRPADVEPGSETATPLPAGHPTSEKPSKQPDSGPGGHAEQSKGPSEPPVDNETPKPVSEGDVAPRTLSEIESAVGESVSFDASQGAKPVEPNTPEWTSVFGDLATGPEDQSDTAEWHAAFQRLAEQVDGPDDGSAHSGPEVTAGPGNDGEPRTAGPPVEKSAGQPHGAEREQTKDEPVGEDQPIALEQTSQQVGETADSLPSELTEEAEKRRLDFQKAVQQAGQESEAHIPPSDASKDSDASESKPETVPPRADEVPVVDSLAAATGQADKQPLDYRKPAEQAGHETPASPPPAEDGPNDVTAGELETGPGAPLLESGATTPTDEAEKRRLEFQRAAQLASQENASSAPSEAAAGPDETEQEPDEGPPPTTSEDTPAQPKTNDEAEKRRLEFQKAAQLAGQENAGSTPLETVAAADEGAQPDKDRRERASQDTTTLSLSAPDEAEESPAADSPESSDWHNAFERLAAQRTPEAAEIPSGQVGEVIGEPDATKSAARQNEFDRLRAEAVASSLGAAPSDSGPRQAEKPSGETVGPSVPLTGSDIRTDAPPQVVDTELEEPLIQGGRRTGLVTAFKTVGSKASKNRLLNSIGERLRDVMTDVGIARPTEVTSLTIEHGAVKVLVTQDLEVLDYRIEQANESLFREGLVSDSPRVSSVLQRALLRTKGSHRHVIGAVPGFQTTLRRLELPNVKGLDPSVIIPNEASRNMGISTETSSLTWQRLPGTVDTSHWLVLSAPHRSISSLSATAAGAGVRLKSAELRAFALARAINEPDAIIAWTAAEGCDAVVVRDWVPVTQQSAYWGAGSTLDATDLINRVTEVVESTMTAHDMQNPELSSPSDVPVYVSGTPAGQEEGVSYRVAANLRRPAGEIDVPIAVPDDFPMDDLIVNVGLALWAA